jgi:hypothetical protein
MERNRAVSTRERGAVTAAATLAVSLAALAPAVAAPVGPAGPAAAMVTAGEDPADRLLAPVPDPGRSDESRDRVLAEVAHAGHHLTFVEHITIGTVGVFETAGLGATPYLASMTSDGRDQPTALELYLAVSSAAPPAALVADHARHSTSPPLAVALPTASGQEPADGSCAYHDAIQFGSVWALNWHLNVGLFHDLHNQLSFFDHINGNVGKAYDAYRSRARWLAACNGDHIAGFPDIYLIPEFRVDGEWEGVQPRHVEPGTQEIYWSAHGPERWRLRMKESLDFNVNNVRNWAIGGAIDLPLPLVLKG